MMNDCDDGLCEWCRVFDERAGDRAQQYEIIYSYVEGLYVDMCLAMSLIVGTTNGFFPTVFLSFVYSK